MILRFPRVMAHMKLAFTILNRITLRSSEVYFAIEHQQIHGTGGKTQQLLSGGSRSRRSRRRTMDIRNTGLTGSSYRILSSVLFPVPKNHLPFVSHFVSNTRISALRSPWRRAETKSFPHSGTKKPVQAPGPVG